MRSLVPISSNFSFRFKFASLLIGLSVDNTALARSVGFSARAWDMFTVSPVFKSYEVNNGQNISHRSEHRTCHSHRSNAHCDKYLSLNSFQTQSSQKCQHIIHSATISKIQQTNIEKVSQIRFFGGEGKHNDHGLTCDLWGCFVDQSRSIFRQ